MSACSGGVSACSGGVFAPGVVSASGGCPLGGVSAPEVGVWYPSMH